jgi:TPP-dependent indolepyruvate ferredoxin oxidoreductase alpha subunit
VIGKAELDLEEIGELTPDLVRAAFAKLELTDKPETSQKIDLPPRPPALCPGCPHRAFYYALNMVNHQYNATTKNVWAAKSVKYSAPLKKRVHLTLTNQGYARYE